jgi:steroid 5-alpha reductase family enzyme
MTETFFTTVAMFVVLWVASLAVRDASIVDRFWGVAFLVIASASSAASDGYETRSRLVLALVAIWGLRLSLHITMRSLGEPEDYRYAAMRRAWGTSFPLASLVTVFLLQAVIAWVVSFPVQAAVSATRPATWTAWDTAGTLVWTIGFVFEAVGDWQLARFKDDPANAGKVMDRGLWRWSRHPNYFGDAVVWWGFGLFAIGVGAWWTLVGPLLMTFLLLRVSGVALLEKKLRRTRPEYEDYVRRTSAFVPWRRR